MSTFLAFFKKERMEQLRTGRFTVLMIVFVLFGIMNPAIAKLTPWLMETLSATLAEAGVTFTNITVDAMTSWTQYYKNIPMALIFFVLMTSGAFTTEYQKGTLIPVLTKGLKRGKVLAAKALALLGLWTVAYALCLLVTYGYTAMFWDNGVARHLWFTAFLYYLFGVWIMSVMVLFSTLLSSSTGVLAGTGAAVLAAYLLSMVPGLGRLLPLYLTESLPLLTGALAARSMGWAAGIACGLILLQGAVSACAFRKRSI